MAPCLLLQTVPEAKATGAYAWSKASRAREPTGFLRLLTNSYQGASGSDELAQNSGNTVRGGKRPAPWTKTPGAFLNNATRWPGYGRTSGMRCVIARAAPAKDGVFLRLYGRRMLPEPAFSLNEKGACQPVKRQVITQSGAAQGLAVLAPLRGSFTSFVCLTDRRGWHILCRPAFRPRPAGSPGRLILFSAADCLLLSGTGLL